MKIQKGTQLINKGKEKERKAIIEFVFTNYKICVFQGILSPLDILIKYKKDNTRMRTPKHIHWVVDILMKIQGNEELAKQYLKEIQICWNKCIPLKNNNFETLEALIIADENVVEIDKYANLNRYGEYDVEFLYVLMELLAVQEKTNRSDAYMFGNIIEELLKPDRDIFKIISTAGFGGKAGKGRK